MRFVKISCFSLFVFCFFTLKASDIDEESWQLSGAFFLEKKCYISIQDTRKSEKGTMQNSSMMVLNCEPFLPMLREIPRWKPPLKKRDQLRYCALYNSFFFHQNKISNLFKNELYEVDLLEDSYFRSVVVLALRERLKIDGSFKSVFLAVKILRLLGEKKP